MNLQYDLLIRNALSVNGTRWPRFPADIGARLARALCTGAAAQRAMDN